MRRCEAALAAAALVLTATPALAADPAPVVAAERAFAADALTLGAKASFLKWAGPEAVFLQPEPARLADALKRAPDKGGPAFYWWPSWAGLARSGDLGFTAGPFTRAGKPAGYYLTVWQKQADGHWRWIYKGGAGGTGPHLTPPPASKPRVLAPAPNAAGSARQALKEVGAAETGVAAAAEKDLKAAYAAVLADDARVQGSPAAPADTPRERERELATRPAAASFKAVGAVASKAGDLAFTYGEARWSREGAENRGYYARVWRKGQAGWRIVYDQLQAVPPKAPANAKG
ncbi:MAG: DUF4440 domain-containing protein [Phenylobacterium sp.]